MVWTETVYDPRGRRVEVNKVADATESGGGTFLGTLIRRTYFTDGYTEETNAAPTDDDARILGEDWRWDDWRCETVSLNYVCEITLDARRD